MSSEDIDDIFWVLRHDGRNREAPWRVLFVGPREEAELAYSRALPRTAVSYAVTLLRRGEIVGPVRYADNMTAMPHHRRVDYKSQKAAEDALERRRASALKKAGARISAPLVRIEEPRLRFVDPEETELEAQAEEEAKGHLQRRITI